MDGEEPNLAVGSAAVDRENRLPPADQLPATVSILVVSHNARDDLANCLASVRSQSYPHYEIIVVDCASTDDTVGLLRREFPQVRLYASAENLGYRRGNNLGFQQATDKYILLLNQDAGLDSGCLAEMVAVAESDRSVALVAPKILLDDDRERINEAGNTLHYTGMYGSRGNGEPASQYSSSETVAAVSGCCFLIRREVLQELEGFSADFDALATGFHASSEEADLGWRAQLLGYQIRYTPRAVVYHKYVRKPMSPERFCTNEWGRWLMVSRNYEWPTLFWLSPILLLCEAGMWAYALTKGSGWLKAKWKIAAWVLVHGSTLRNMRRRVQRRRVVRDGVILKRMSPSIHVAHLVPRWPAIQRLQVALNLFFAAYYRFLLKVIANGQQGCLAAEFSESASKAVRE